MPGLLQHPARATYPSGPAPLYARCQQAGNTMLTLPQDAGAGYERLYTRPVTCFTPWRQGIPCWGTRSGSPAGPNGDSYSDTHTNTATSNGHEWPLIHRVRSPKRWQESTDRGGRPEAVTFESTRTSKAKRSSRLCSGRKFRLCDQLHRIPVTDLIVRIAV